jgi:2-haloacid dehalogenase
MKKKEAKTLETLAPEINTVIFDLGGVLIDWNPRYLYKKIFTIESEMERFLRDVCNMQWNEQLDLGRNGRECVRELSAVHPQHADHIAAYWDRWSEMIAGDIAGTVEIFRELRTKGEHRLLALSNWSEEKFNITRPHFDFLNWFDGIVLSGVEKMVKPDLRFYQILLQRHDVEPRKAVFIDDMKKNIEAAQSLGIHTIHFTDPSEVRSRLSDMGVL